MKDVILTKNGKPIFEDKMKTVVITNNGKHVKIVTDYIPYPLGHGYETQVFRCNSNGNVTNYIKELDCKRYGESKTAAAAGHSKMINKWLKETI